MKPLLYRSPSGVKLADSEKKRLLEVARRNAINMLKNGAVPAGAAALPPHTRNQVMAAIQSGGEYTIDKPGFHNDSKLLWGLARPV